MNAWITYALTYSKRLGCWLHGHDRREYNACRALQTCPRCHTSWVVTQERKP